VKLNNLIQLVVQNRDKPRQFKIEAEDDDATIFVYDIIGADFFGGVGAQQFARDLSQITASTIHLRVNSPGGDVWDGRAMMTALRQHKAKIIAHIDGAAASAATSLVMAADEVEITRGAEFMIHNAWTIALGNRHDFLSLSERLEQVDNEIVTDYNRRTGIERSELAELMDAETWFTAEEVVEKGFADRMVETVEGVGNVTRWNLSAYGNPPKSEEPDLIDEALEQAKAHHDQLERRLRIAEAASA